MTFKQSEIIENFLNYFHKVLEEDYHLLTKLAIDMGDKINFNYIKSNLSVEIYKEYIDCIVSYSEIDYHKFFINLGLLKSE